MVSVDKATTARLTFAGKHFEVLVDPDVALKFKKGEQAALSQLLAVNEVYSDSRKGLKPSTAAIQEAFQTTDVIEVAKIIIKKGELQLTTAQRQALIEEKRRGIIAIISRESFNPQTKTPHPPQRIELAMQEAKIQIDPFKPAVDQVEKVLEAIRHILPISMEKFKIEVTVPPMHTGRVYGILHNHNMTSEEWLPDGRLKAVVSIPAGIEDEFYNELNHATKGDISVRRL